MRCDRYALSSCVTSFMAFAQATNRRDPQADAGSSDPFVGDDRGVERPGLSRERKGVSSGV